MEGQEELVNAEMEALVPQHFMLMDASLAKAPPLFLLIFPGKDQKSLRKHRKNPKCALNSTLQWAESPIFLSRNPF